MRLLLVVLALTACGIKGDPLPVEDSNTTVEAR